LGARELVLRWLVAFAITQAVECPIYIRAFGVRPLVAFGASAITHPVVCFVAPRVWEAIYAWAVAAHPAMALGNDAYFVGYGVLAETFAIVVEALYLARWARLGLRRGALASIVANAASGLTGLACSYLFGWP
jgi:hypothetical protein